MSKNLIFISYAHANQRAFKRFQIHLKSVIRDKDIDGWSDERIKMGQDWHEEIQKALARSVAAVLLISPEFLASDYIANSELPVLLKAARDRGLKIFPLILSPCAIEATVFRYPNPKTGPHSMKLSELQAANAPNQTLSEMTSPRRDRVFMSVALAIVAEDLPPPPLSTASQESQVIPPEKSEAPVAQQAGTNSPRTITLVPIPIPIPLPSKSKPQSPLPQAETQHSSRQERFQQIQMAAYHHVESFQRRTNQTCASLVGSRSDLPVPGRAVREFADHVVLEEYLACWGKDGWVSRRHAENLPLFTYMAVRDVTPDLTPPAWLYRMHSIQRKGERGICPMYAAVVNDDVIRRHTQGTQNLARVMLRLFFVQLGHFVLHRDILFPSPDQNATTRAALNSTPEQAREAWIYASTIIGLALAERAYLGLF